MSSDRIKVTKIGESMILHISEDITVANTESLTREIEEYVGRAKKNLFLDLKEVGFVDSYGMRFLLAVNRYARQNDVELFLCDVSLNIRKSLERVFLGREFKFLNRAPTVQAAEAHHSDSAHSEKDAVNSQASPEMGFSFKANYVNVRCLRDAVVCVCRNLEIDKITCETIEKLLFELCDNIIRHGYLEECDKRINVVLTTDEFHVRISVSDSAPAFNIKEKIDELRKHGTYILTSDPVGIRFVASAVSDYSYERIDDRNMFSFSIKYLKNI